MRECAIWGQIYSGLFFFYCVCRHPESQQDWPVNAFETTPRLDDTVWPVRCAQPPRAAGCGYSIYLTVEGVVSEAKVQE